MQLGGDTSFFDGLHQILPFRLNEFLELLLVKVGIAASLPDLWRSFRNPALNFVISQTRLGRVEVAASLAAILVMVKWRRADHRHSLMVGQSYRPVM